VDTVAATDPDTAQSQTLTFAITAGNASGAFAIDPASGELAVANPAALDFEMTQIFDLTVQVTDNGSGNLSDSGAIMVGLVDLNEFIAIHDLAVPEGSSGPSLATFTLTLAAASGLPATVSYLTAPGTAAEGVDYVAACPSVGGQRWNLHRNLPGHTVRGIERGGHRVVPDRRRDGACRRGLHGGLGHAHVPGGNGQPHGHGARARGHGRRARRGVPARAERPHGRNPRSRFRPGRHPGR
jgi:hypothetical protein